MSITNFIQKIKGFMDSEKGRLIAFILIVILTGISSFLLGRVSLYSENNDKNCVTIENSTNIIKQSEIYKSIYTSSSEQASAINTVHNTNKTGSYVASSRGKRFYPVDCSASSSIVSKNRVYFNTREEAIQKGYSPSLSCE